MRTAVHYAIVEEQFEDFTDEQLSEISEELMRGNAGGHRAQRLNMRELLLAASIGLQTLVAERKRMNELRGNGEGVSR